VIGGARNVSIRGISFVNAANYAILFKHANQVEVRDVTISGGWDGVHFRGTADRNCKRISIVGCRFFTGDDAIAGCYAEDLVIRNCELNSSCNGIRIIGPLSRTIIQNCLFYGPGVHPFRTTNRSNMLAGIMIQPGGWGPCEGPLEDMLVADITMRDVAAPLSLWVKRPGNTVQNIIVSRLSAFGVYRASASLESWVDEPIRDIEFRDVVFQYVDGKEGEPPTVAQPPNVDTRALPAWGFYARNVENLRFVDVDLVWRGDAEPSRPKTLFENLRGDAPAL